MALKRPEEGSLRTDPFLYLGGDSGDEIRHILERSTNSLKRIFTGSNSRPIIHLISETKPEFSPSDMDDYRAHKINAEGWDADTVDRHLYRLNHPAEFRVVQEGQRQVLIAVDTRWGGESHDSVLSGFAQEFASYISSNGSFNLGYALLQYWEKHHPVLLAEVKAELDEAGNRSLEIIADLGLSMNDDMTPVLQQLYDEGYDVVDIKVNNGPLYRHPDLIRGSTGNGEPILRLSPKARTLLGPFAGAVMINGFSSNLVSLQMFEHRVWDDLFAEPALANFASHKPTTFVEPVEYHPFAPSRFGVGLPMRGYLLTMPDGVSEYRLALESLAETTVSGVAGLAGPHAYQAATVRFPMLQRHIEKQIESGVLNADQKAKAEEAVAELAARPDGLVCLVWYSSPVPLPYKPIDRLPIEQFAQRADMSIRKKEVAKDTGITWGQAESAVHKKGSSDTFCVVHSSVLDTVSSEIEAWVGSPATHHLYFTAAAGGYRCYLADNVAGILPGSAPLSEDDILMYSQLGYSWRYDGYLEGFEDPRAEVLAKLLPGYSVEDLQVPDPYTGEPLHPGDPLRYRMDIRNFYEDGYLFYAKVPEPDRPLVALVNQGVGEPKDLITMVKQMLTQGYGAMVARLDTYPKLDF